MSEISCPFMLKALFADFCQLWGKFELDLTSNYENFVTVLNQSARNKETKITTLIELIIRGNLILVFKETKILAIIKF